MDREVHLWRPCCLSRTRASLSWGMGKGSATSGVNHYCLANRGLAVSDCRITTFIWRHILVLAYIWSYYFICVCPAVLLSCNICHLLKGGDLAGFIHMDAAFLHFSPLFLNENTWPLAVRLRLSNITSGGLKYARTVHFAVCCFCHHEEELPLAILEPSKGTRMGRNHPSWPADMQIRNKCLSLRCCDYYEKFVPFFLLRYNLYTMKCSDLKYTFNLFWQIYVLRNPHS